MSEDAEIERLIDRLVRMGAIRAGSDPVKRARFADLGKDRLAEMVASLERGIAHAEAARRPVEDGGAKRALLRARLRDSLDRLGRIGRRDGGDGMNS